MYVLCIYLFRNHRKYLNTNRKNGSARDFIIKYLVKREAKSKKIPVDRRWQG